MSSIIEDRTGIAQLRSMAKAQIDCAWSCMETLGAFYHGSDEDDVEGVDRVERSIFAFLLEALVDRPDTDMVYATWLLNEFKHYRKSRK